MRRLLALILLLGLAACGHRPTYAPGLGGLGNGGRAVYAPDLPRGWSGACDQPANARQAARINAGSIDTLPVSPFGHTEIGWRTYAPLTAHETATLCPPDSAAKAGALHDASRGSRVPGKHLASCGGPPPLFFRHTPVFKSESFRE